MTRQYVVGTIHPWPKSPPSPTKGMPCSGGRRPAAGALPLDMGALGDDLLAFTGHKSLLGHQYRWADPGLGVD